MALSPYLSEELDEDEDSSSSLEDESSLEGGERFTKRMETVDREVKRNKKTFAIYTVNYDFFLFVKTQDDWLLPQDQDNLLFSSRRRIYPNAFLGDEEYPEEEDSEEYRHDEVGQAEVEQNIQNKIQMDKKDIESLIYQVGITNKRKKGP